MTGRELAVVAVLGAVLVVTTTPVDAQPSRTARIADEVLQ